MKGFVIFAIFSIMYVLLVILFNGIAGAEFANSPPPPIQQHGNISPQPSPDNKFPRQEIPGIFGQFPSPVGAAAAAAAPPAPRPPPNGSGNPIVDIFKVEDPTTKNMLDAAYGTYHGDDQCMRKSACILGNYMKDLPGRDLMFILAGGYIPPEYSLFYDIFRNSALYGQNCDVYVCIAANQVQGQFKTPSASGQATSQ
ncbi:uncharacterized protein LOC110856871 isoform X2 [Folsomia candida]|uniref:uncharacterized protein LOC110856871 isoform X2 n=1 Tax=Folsomia candida TaxID=158441 RepID=UPI000B90552E|nr:uncharacterized protein LOC110856871 isoform X2 [Folsomia candida]